MQRFTSHRAAIVGAELLPDGGVHFRVWAPRRRTVSLVLHGPERTVPMRRDGDGYFAVDVPDVRAGTRYRFRLEGEDALYPDPGSRFQPEGPHGPSEVIDPGFAWTDAAWPGVSLDGLVLYELHVGTFTPEGTYEAAARQLEALRDLGVTCLELMPVAEFPGRFGWGYDGVDLFAPMHHYGRPEDLKRFIDRAHALDLGVILDVVYNHLGPDGNYLEAFSPEYFTDRYSNEWGRAINFDGDGSAPVREFFVANAAYWVSEYHFDGLRLDATQSIHDASPRHVVSEIAAAARTAAAPRRIVVVAENEPQDAAIARPERRGGLGLDALWNDDFHHSAVVAATGRAEAYYSDHRGTPQELISAVKWGYLFQGQRYEWQDKRRGTPALDLPPPAFVLFLENHDQVANTCRGARLAQQTTPGRYRALTALLLLVPGTPMLFQGQEFSSSKPFLYFADHRPDLALRVRRGRSEFLGQFASIADPPMRERLRDPGDPATFDACKLDLTERERHAGAYALHRDLLELRRTDAAFRAQGRERRVEGATLGPEAFVLRYFAPSDAGAVEPDRARARSMYDSEGDRLLVVNLGRDLALPSVPEPLLAPPAGCLWQVRFSTEDPVYGGGGTPPVEDERGRWRLPGHTAVVLSPRAVPPEGHSR